MYNSMALQRQHQELEKIREELDGAVSSLLLGYKDELAIKAGEVPELRDANGSIEMQVHLKHDVVAVPCTTIPIAEELIALLKSIQTEVGTEPQIDSLSGVPDEDWERFMRLHKEFADTLQRAKQLGEKLHAFRIDKIEKHR